MNIISNATIARKYGVSRPTVSRWVDLAQQGKNNLQLTEGDNPKVIDNPNNEAELERLFIQGQEYKRSIPIKKTEPSGEIYKIFSEDELIEIMNNLEFEKEFNLKFSYRNGGAEIWDARYMSGISPIRKATLDFTSKISDDITYLLGNPNLVNIIDIGPGNSHPVKSLLEVLDKKGILNKYVPIDISEDMLEISRNNVKTWLPELEVKPYRKDIEADKFAKIFYENKSLSQNIPNVILFIGNTIDNSDDRVQVLKNLRSGMTYNDLLIVTYSLDSKATRSTLGYAKSKEADRHHSWVGEMCGIDIDKCKIIAEYDDSIGARVKYLVLDKDYEITFKLLGEKKSVLLKYKEKICIWKHYLLNDATFQSELESAKLQVIASRKDETLNNNLVITKIV
jgi:uncharacterized SAM-dependent methyltransferase